ncbi:hypothetical protein SAMN05421505_14436 [Sinosporangium album]|uniref:Uncharacterized protein n=1 Tax=Sinosporangium album TaxID=504805 RepID=A0A1G8JPJ4_9ACTN|nr:hypothetical protein [Sinosporangium album]SDI33021.1 hypothetical protein SAMN05421505_14436 [Sinosporangium album]
MLTRVLKSDMLLCAVSGLLLALAADPLGDLFALPAPLLRWAGIVLLPVAAFIGYVVSRTPHPTGAVWAIMTLNSLWVVDSVILLFTGWVDPNALGIAFIIAQALVVVVFVELQYIALRRLRRAPHAMAA